MTLEPIVSSYCVPVIGMIELLCSKLQQSNESSFLDGDDDEKHKLTSSKLHDHHKSLPKKNSNLACKSCIGHLAIASELRGDKAFKN